jgi:hypothetical protein
MWGLMKKFPVESGNTNSRDDMVLFKSTDRHLKRYEARWDGTVITYWWSWTVPYDLLLTQTGLVT